MTLSSAGTLHALSSAVSRRDRMRAVVRGLAALAGILSALAPLALPAVGLGPVTQQSGLGQSLRVVVPVTLAEGEEIPSECFKLAPAREAADEIPQVLFGRVAVERTPSGSVLVVTNARPLNDPVVKLTIQAGCDISMRREYTLFMDPPAIEPPVVAAESTPREVAAVPQRPPAARGSSRATGTRARAATRGASSSGSASDDGSGTARKGAPPKARAAAKAAPKRPPAAAADRPRLSVSSATPGVGTGVLTEADREKAQQELANSIEAETVILRQRIVELTALVERMQQEVQAQEMAQRVADAAAKAPRPAPEPDWWEANASLVAAIVGLPLLIAAGLLWNRRRDAARDAPWRPTRAPAPRAAPDARRTPALRNAPAGLAKAEPQAAAPASAPRPERIAHAADAGDALAVSELSQVTEEARVYVALGHHDRAIEVLHEHIRQLPRSLPAAWLMLLDLHHITGGRQEFRKLAEEFHLHFNVQTPTWEGFAPDESDSGGLDAFPHIIRQVTNLWRKPECRGYLERLLYDNREGRRTGFPLSTYADILTLLQVLDAPEPVDIDLDLVDGGKLDLAPRAPATPTPPTPSPAPSRAATPAEPARSRRPMPPDPSASARPVQQPIKFEIDPDELARDSGKKPRS